MALSDTTAPVYRYFTTDLLSNTVLAEIPFRGVSFERSIKAAGSFSGNINVIPGTASMDLYDSTMPGKTALYIIRDQECVWGGIIWNRSYNVVERDLSVSASEFTSYFHHRNIWKTWSHDIGADLVVSGGTVTGTLINLTYDFPIGSSVKIVFPTANMFQYNAYYTIATSPTNETFTVTGTTIPNGTYKDVTVYSRVDTYDFVRQLLDNVLTDFGDISFANDEIAPGTESKIRILTKKVASGVATITTDTAHNIIPNQVVRIYNVDSQLDGTWLVTSVPSTTSFTFQVAGGNVALTSITSPSGSITKKSIVDFVGTITTSAAHGLVAGDVVTISGVDGASVSVINKKLVDNVATITTSAAHGANIEDSLTVTGVDATFNGIYPSAKEVTTNTISYDLEAPDVASTVVSGGNAVINVYSSVFNGIKEVVSATSTTFTVYVTDSDMAEVTVSGSYAKNATVVVLSGGSFPSNADIGMVYSTEEYSGKSIPNKNYRGFEIKSVGSELDDYSDTVKGFEYRIDCAIEYVGAAPVFTRTFVLIPIDFPSPPAAGEVSPPSRYGADQLVFEYPGSIIDVNMEESAEDSATRFFVTGNIPEQGNDVSQPYAAATATDLLSLGWPLLDKEENKNDIYDEDLLYYHAKRYLIESRPPISDIKVKVNGSLSPKVGEYSPGDWCSIAVDDEFIRMRLASDLEVRDTVIVRKIEGYRVNVPDSPSFPEEVELTLVAEAEVDRVGQ